MSGASLIEKVESLPAFLRGPEDDGVGALLGAQAAGTGASPVEDPRVLDAARTVLVERLAVSYLAPFAPAAERNAQVVAVLRQAIVAAREAQEAENPLYGVPLERDVLLAIYSRTIGWHPIQKYLDDPRINEIKINGTTVMVQEAGGEFVVVPEQFATAEEVIRRASFLATAHRVRLDEATPQVSIPAEYGTRVHVSIYPVVDRGSVLVCIRRGRTSAWDLRDVEARGTINSAIRDLLGLLARAGCSFLLAGATGSGKTALLEALINSLPGDIHVLTIEDLTRELFLRRAELWTRELVDTIRDPDSFSRAAREALRQTPGLLAVGETRGKEAGAILSLGMSGHPVATTMHAQDAQRAVERFASYASLPGAYLYEGRRDDALRDAVSAFQVVIFVEQLAGRRLVSEISLTSGVALDDAGRLQPVLVPLARLVVRDGGGLDWELLARALPDGSLGWANGESTPAALDRKLRAALMASALRSARPSVNDVAETEERARQAIAVGDAERALNIMQPAWARTRDSRLLVLARQAIALAPARFAHVRDTAQHAAVELEILLQGRLWARSQAAFDGLMAELAAAAVAEPAGGWGAIAERIGAGMAVDAEVARACADAELELAAGRPWAAIEALERFDTEELAPSPALLVIRGREAAQRALVDRGEGSPDVLRTLVVRREALEERMSREDNDRRAV